MITGILVGLLALALLGFVAVPLLAPDQADPLPEEGDPVLQELREEKQALLRAITELDGRTDLPVARREELRNRYEAKAARTMRALDEAEAERRGERPTARPARSTRVPVAALSLLAIAGVTAVTLSAWVLPRVGDGATVTSFFEDDLARAERLRDLQRAVQDDPSADALLALADAYWQAEDVDGATSTYRRIVDEVDAPPAVAYRRLALLTLPQDGSGATADDVAEARRLLDRARAADPDDPDTLATLGELAFAQGDYLTARDAWRSYREAASADDPLAPQAERRLALLDAIAPAAAAYGNEVTQATTTALADALWEAEELQRALSLYFDVLTRFDATDVHATERTGEALFLAGRVGDAAQILARAIDLAEAQGVAPSPRTLLFLGNARFQNGDDAGAIAAWERYLETSDAPGRVPGLIEQARARIAGGATSPSAASPSALVTGSTIYQTHCALCHGVGGRGGTGPALVGNRRSGDAANVENAVRWGRGLMPGFGARLSGAEIDAVVAYVVDTYGGSSTP